MDRGKMMGERDRTNLDYLVQGNERQKEAYFLLQELGIMDVLRFYDPILVGTIPIDIDIPGSDLDVICEVHDFKRFEALVRESFGHLEGFRVECKQGGAGNYALAKFVYRNRPFEIFGQPLATKLQNGYRHMDIEARILEHLGERGKLEIRELKRSGLKTEPAFGKLLRLQGDPYRELLEMGEWDEECLAAFLDHFKEEGFDYMILGIHHAQITIPKGKEEEAKAFYCGVLGLPEKNKPDSLAGRGGFWLQVGDREVHVGAEDGFDRTLTKAHIAYQVLDLQEVEQALSAVNIKPLESVPIPGYERFEIRDPFGNRVEFIQPIE